ncbi:unnamed protein product, partial [Mesorhabditis spiculigera]
MQAGVVHKRERHRHTIFQLDSLLGNAGRPDRPVSINCSMESLNSSSNSSRKRYSTRDRNYNVRILKDLKQNGQRPLPEDVGEARRECQNAYNDRSTDEERRQTIQEALDQLDQLALFLDPEPANQCGKTLFVAEYQGFVCWVYTKIRFGNFCWKLEKYFQDVKQRHRQILECLKTKRLRVERLSAILRFSQLCLVYAEVCDAEALRWYIRARSGSRSSDHRLQGTAAEERKEREEKRVLNIQELLTANICQIELIWTLKGLSSTKQEMLV